MPDRHRTLTQALISTALLGAIALAGCGGSSASSRPASSTLVPSTPATSTGGPPATASATSSAPAATSGSTPAGAGALSADVRSAATGDIPDNQVFLVYTDTRAGWSMKYPEGWTQGGSGSNITFSSNNNLVHVVIATGGAPTPGSVAAQLQALKARQPTLSFAVPAAFALPSDPKAVRARYLTESAASPVTGKRVTLMVDRYVLHRGVKIATVDLGTPRGVDNVDAYRMMIRSFRWR